MQFYKMHGAGNDFVMLTGSPVLTEAEIQKICARRTGLGADGLIFIEKSQGENCFIMHYYNSDGSKADFCGNGARCALYLAWHLNWPDSDTIHFQGGDGSHVGKINPDRSVSVSITAPAGFEHIGSIENLPFDLYFVNTGVEHVVCYTDSLKDLDLETIGRKIRYSPKFPKGTNVNFISRTDHNTLAIRTYERGVEAETLACGTGISAASFTDISIYGGKLTRDIVTVAGFQLTAGFYDNTFLLTGPAEIVATGELDDVWLHAHKKS